VSAACRRRSASTAWHPPRRGHKHTEDTNTQREKFSSAHEGESARCNSGGVVDAQGCAVAVVDTRTMCMFMCWTAQQRPTREAACVHSANGDGAREALEHAPRCSTVTRVWSCLGTPASRQTRKVNHQLCGGCAHACRTGDGERRACVCGGCGPLRAHTYAGDGLHEIISHTPLRPAKS
jgi:hypothetical protein